MQQIRSFFLVLFIANFISPVMAQSGLFGRHNSVEFRYNMSPSIRRKNVVKTSDGDPYVASKLRLINSSYTLKYNRIISNRFSIGLGIDVASMKSMISTLERTSSYQNAFGQYVNFVSKMSMAEPKVQYKGLTLELNFFGKYGINPSGLRGGFSFDFGTMKIDYSELATFTRETTFNNNYTESDEFKYVDYSSLNSANKSIFNLRLNIGKNIIVSRRILVKFDANYSLLTAIWDKENTRTLYSYLLSVLTGNFSRFNSISWNSEANFRTQERFGLMATHAVYKRFTINVGVSYAF
ncbi:MAG: hypothetical protein R3279_08110 [Putridiphycobacter sp.]|nr:hypothetical protein [Putridiphycobacter sp.]